MRKEKQFLLDEVEEQLEESSTFLLLSYKGLNANSANEFRNLLAKMGGRFEVVRKRILLKAAEKVGVSLDLRELKGHIGVAMGGKDPLEMTKAVFKFGNSSKMVEVLGGRFDGQLYNAVQVETLSKLPSRDEMRAQLLATLEAPLSQTLGVMDALMTSVVYCLDNKCKQNS